MVAERFKAQNRTLAEWFNVIRAGTIRLPRFQRHIAWDRETVVGLVETVLRELPAGAALVLNVGQPAPFESRHLVGAPQTDANVTEHLLDGQQRLTALWRALHDKYDDLSIFIRWDAHPESADEQVVVDAQPRWNRKGTKYPVWCDDPAAVFKRGLVPVDLLAPDAQDRTVAWLKAAISGDSDAVLDWVSRLSAIRQQVSAYNIPYLSLAQGTPPGVALDVFIKMNTSNVKLTAFDVVVAQVEAAADKSIHDLLEVIRTEAHHADAYGDLGTLLLDTSCLLADTVSSKTNYLRLDFGKLAESWLGLVEPLQMAVALLEEERVFDGSRLPTGAVLPVITALASELPTSGYALGNARTLLHYYLWRAFLTGRYVSSAGSRAYADYTALRDALRDGRSFTEVAAPIFDEARYPIPSAEQLLTARWPKTRDILGRGVLALMLREGGLDIADEQPATRESVRKREYHHLFPDSILTDRAGLPEGESFRALNCALVTWQTNRQISNKSPLEYLTTGIVQAQLGESEIKKRLASHLVPWDQIKTAGPYPDQTSAATIRTDYEEFRTARAQLIASKAAERAGQGLIGTAVKRSALT